VVGTIIYLVGSWWWTAFIIAAIAALVIVGIVMWNKKHPLQKDGAKPEVKSEV
jgi:hypothetical protein